MANALAMFDDKKLKLPSHLADLNEEGNIGDRNSVPSLGITGKVFEISINGDKKKLVKVDEDGDEIPLSVFRAVVLDYAKKRGRAYYEGDYDANAVKQPTCWSTDGVLPHDSVPEKQSPKCETCPLAAKGSKVSPGGKAVAACGQHRMVVVVPANDLSHPPLRLKLAVTSDWDKNDDWAAQGFFGFSNYTEFLRTKGVKHTAALVTKMRFDPNEAYPKLLFSPDKWLSEDQIAIIKPILGTEEVTRLLGDAFTPAGVDGKPVEKAEAPKVNKIAAKAAPALADEDEDEAPAPAPKAAKKAPVTLDGDDDDVKVATPPKRTIADPSKGGEKFIKPVKLDDDDDDEAPAPKATKAKAAIAIDDEDEDEAPKPVAAKAQAKKGSVDKAPSKAAQATTSVPEDVDALLNEWADAD